MSEFFFVLKTLGITLAIVLILQLRVGPQTIEQRSLAWMHQSAAVDSLRGVADGAVTVAIEGSTWAKKTWNKQFGGSPAPRRSSDAHSESEHRAKKQKAWESEAHSNRGDEVD